MKRIENIPEDLQTLFDFGISNPDPANVEAMMTDMREAVLRSIGEPASKPTTNWTLMIMLSGRTGQALEVWT